MRKIAVAAFLFFLVTGFAEAQVPTSGNVFFGYSYYNANVGGQRTSLNGWNGSVEGKFLPFIGVVGDFSGYYGSQNFTTCTVPILDCVIIQQQLHRAQLSVWATRFFFDWEDPALRRSLDRRRSYPRKRRRI